MADFKIATFNCKNFNGVSRFDFVSKVLTNCDIVCLQEHHLFESELSSLSSLCNGSLYTGTSAMDQSKFYRGRKFGGTAIVWKSSLNYAVHNIEMFTKRASCIKIELCKFVSMLVFSIYMPCDAGYVNDGFREYQDILAEISVICEQNNATYICLAGDFNSDFRRSSPNTQELNDFCANENFVPLVNNDISTVEYTFESACGTLTCIDHIIVTENLANSVKSYYCIDDICNLSDHMPVMVEFDIPCTYNESSFVENKERCAWYKASIKDISQYKCKLDTILDCSWCDRLECIKCSNATCNKENHINELNYLYNHIVNACIQASIECIPIVSSIKRKKVLPGFSEYCKPLRDEAVKWHNLWKDQGRPSSGFYADKRKVTRSEYHKCVRKVKVNENKIRSQKMAEAIKCNNQRNLWSEVKKIKSSARCISSNIDGITDQKGITELFAKKYNELYNSVNYNDSEIQGLFSYVNDMIADNNNDLCNSATFGNHDVRKALEALKHSKHDGYSGLYSDHLIFGSDKLISILVKLFNGMIIHGVSVTDMLVGTLTPIPKNKRMSVCNSENYRSICLQSVLCKVIDIMILNKQRSQFGTSDMQFGFKQGLSAGLATSVLLETTDYYVNHGGSVFALALDASKAFDRVQYVMLFKLLISRNVNPYYIRFLLQSYLNQELRVNYNGIASNWFKVSNGVKQGGVLSPTLFGVYIDGMLQEIKNKGLGCNVGDVNCGILGYADDVILLAPTRESLNAIVRCCESYAKSFHIKFNGKKSKLIVFGSSPQNIILNVNGERVDVVNEINYLGHVITNRKNDPMIKSVKNDFITKVNTFLGNFSCVSSDIKNALFKQYCTSFYGSQSCMMYHSSFNELKIAWRKAMRRIWNVPYRTHGVLLPVISCQSPCDVIFYTRFMKHYISGLNHKNASIRDIFHSSMYNGGRLYKNLRHVVSYCKLKQFDVIDLTASSAENILYNAWADAVSEDDLRVGCQIKELCMMRDSWYDWCLNVSETNDIINHLCTS